MSWQQITMIVLFSISFAINLVKHGEDKGKYNFGVAALALSIEFYILFSAGFFSSK